MSLVLTQTIIRAPIERVFDLSLSIDLHLESTAHTGEMAIAGVTTGLIGLGQDVTWKARHFGVWQTLTSRITKLERPNAFQDCMVSGAFSSFVHDHEFSNAGEFTRVNDRFEFRSPFGLLGRAIDSLILNRYMRRLLEKRNAIIKEVAESDRWALYV